MFPIRMECTQILFAFGSAFVRNGKFLAAFAPAVSEHPAAISRGHAVAEAVLICSLFARRLKCAFHRCYFSKGCKDE